MSNVANLLPSRSVVLSSHAGVTVRAERRLAARIRAKLCGSPTCTCGTVLS